MAKEEVERRLKVKAEREAAIKALEEKRADWRATEKRIKKEAYELARADATQEIFKYGMSFKRSTLFMIREKYPDLELSDVNLTEMRGYDKLDPTYKFDQQQDQDGEEGAITATDQVK